MNASAEVARSPSRRLVDRIAFTDAAALIVVVAMWLITRPYRGVRHDAIFYLGQVLHHLTPERFSSDLFFLYGSQDRYSLFAPVFAPLMARFGIGATEAVGVLVFNALFLFGCWKLTRTLASRPLRWAAMLLVAVLPHTYGGLGAFSFAESFLTARSVAEPLALLALWQLISGRALAGAVLVVLATAFHPLIALPVLMIGWVHLVLQRRAWLWLLAVVALVAGLGAFGMAPFDQLFNRFDPEWFKIVRNENEKAFLGAYSLLDWAPAAFDALALVLFARRTASSTLARLTWATLIGVAVLSLLSAIGADLLHDVLLTQIQLWRVYWPMHLLAVLVLPWVMSDYWQRGWVGRWCAFALALAGLAVMSNWQTGWVCLLWALAALAADHWQAKIARTTALAAILGSVVTMLAISFKVARVTLQAVDQSPDRFADANATLIILGLPAIGGALALGVLWLLRHGTRERVLALVLGLVALGYGASMYDQRSDWQRRLESTFDAGPPAFDDVIPPTASVYWDGDLIEPWLVGRRAQFFSAWQGAGSLFNRGTAIEFARRQHVFAGVETQKELCTTIAALRGQPGGPAPVCATTPEVALEPCTASDHPDYLVFATPMSVPAQAVWRYTPRAKGLPDKTFYLYQCSALIQAAKH